MTDFSYVPDKEELRSSLSLAYVCAKLGIRLDRNLRGLCPFHPDSDPSFYLFRHDDGVENWWCHPCGEGGDVFRLLQRAEGLSFPEALLRAAELVAELPPGYEPPVRELSVRVTDVADMESQVLRARARAVQPDHAGILAARSGFAPVDDPATCALWDTYLRVTWGWGIDELGTILCPHWSPAGELTGVKLRRGTQKEAVPGSEFTHLYGSWLGRRSKRVLLTEGESDGIWAGFQRDAAGNPLDLDVFALPRGAASRIEPEWLDFLRNALIYLAFDPDEAGLDATRRWLEALLAADFKEVRVCALPLGRDLRSAAPNLEHLLETARRPLAVPEDVTDAPNGFITEGSRGGVHLATKWTADPIAQLVGEDAGYLVRVRYQGLWRHTTIGLADLAHRGALTKWCERNELLFTASDGDAQAIARWIEARGSIVPQVFQTHVAGLHDAPVGYESLGRSVVFPAERDGYIGAVPWRYVPAPHVKDLKNSVLLPADRYDLVDWSWLEDFLRLSATNVTQPLLAWLVAACRRPEVQDFPILFISGSSGAGKSSLARLALRLTGSAVELDLGSWTPHAIQCALASTTSFPVFIDEWTRLSRRDSLLTFKAAIPIVYSRGVAEKGGLDNLRVARYHYAAPVMVAGEDTFELDRERERAVTLRPTRASQDTGAYARLVDAPLQRIGHRLHLWLTETPPAALPQFRPASMSRPDHNRHVLEVGWQTLLLFLADAAQHEEVPALPATLDLTALDPDPDYVEENVYEQALHLASTIRDQERIPIVWADPQGLGTWVRFQALVGLIESRRLDVELPGRSRAMRNYFAERYWVTKHRAVPLPENGGTASRADLIHDLYLT